MSTTISKASSTSAFFVPVSSPADFPVLERFVLEILIQNFPEDADDLKGRTLRKWKKWLTMGILEAVIAHDAQGRAVAGAVCSYMPRSNTCCTLYLACHPNIRQGGFVSELSMHLYDRLMSKGRAAGYEQGPDMMFAEVTDPRTMPPGYPDGWQPWARLKALQRIGMRWIHGFPYVQPNTGVAHLMLCVFSLAGQVVETEDGGLAIPSDFVRSFVTDLFEAEIGSNYRSDPAFIAQMEWLKGKELLQLVDMDADLPPKASPSVTTENGTANTSVSTRLSTATLVSTTQMWESNSTSQADSAALRATELAHHVRIASHALAGAKHSLTPGGSVARALGLTPRPIRAKL